jgi:nucleotide-binding universal stress UspA family protein
VEVKQFRTVEKHMTIKDLVVQIDQTPAAQVRLDAALVLAEHYEAHLTALFLIAEPFVRGVSGYHLPADIIREHLRHAEAEADAVLAAAGESASGRAIPFEGRREVGPLERLPTILARNARNADLVIVGEPDQAHSGADETVLVETAFMDTGRPALVVPQDGFRALPPRRVIVAWDGSREAARAVHDALPLIRMADDVIILIADAGKQGLRFGHQPGAGVAAHLGRHGITARIKPVQSGGMAIAGLILDQAAQEAADLIVMGGYGHSRLREIMLGGVTRHMLERMTLPVLFAH